MVIISTIQENLDYPVTCDIINVNKLSQCPDLKSMCLSTSVTHFWAVSSPLTYVFVPTLFWQGSLYPAFETGAEYLIAEGFSLFSPAS